MQRRHFLIATSSIAAGLAGCTAGDDGQDDSTPENGYSGLETLPDPEELAESHTETLSTMTFVAEEHVEQTASASGETDVTERTIRSSDAGTLIEGDNVAKNSASGVWFTDDTRIERSTHTYYPDGAPKPYIRDDAVTQIVTLGEFERTEVRDAAEQVYVFEATGVDETQATDENAEYQTFDVRIELSAEGYIRTFDADLTFSAVGSDETRSAVYRYEVTEVGDVSVSRPSFVDDALRVEGELVDGDTVLELEHTGGPTVTSGTELIAQDSEGLPRDGPTLPNDFESGQTAYLYWKTDSDVGLMMGEKPADVAREWVRATEETDRDIYVAEGAGGVPRRFEIRYRSVA